MTPNSTNGSKKPIILNVVTPCSRPENLIAVYNSMWAGHIPGFELRWIVIADADEVVPNKYFRVRYGSIETVLGHLAQPSTGHAQMNLALDHYVKPGWVYRLDDDNLMHPDFIDVFLSYAKRGYYGMAFGQIRAKDGYVAPDLKHIDSGQFVLHTTLIGETRWGLHYTADGEFFREVYAKNLGDSRWIVTEKACTYHNRLRGWGDWDERHSSVYTRL